MNIIYQDITVFDIEFIKRAKSIHIKAITMVICWPFNRILGLTPERKCKERTKVGSAA